MTAGNLVKKCGNFRTYCGIFRMNINSHVNGKNPQRKGHTTNEILQALHLLEHINI